MNYRNELNKVMTCFNYRGRLVWKLIGGYEMEDKKYKSIEEIDDVIDESLRTVGKSMVKVENNGSINCQNDNV